MLSLNRTHIIKSSVKFQTDGKYMAALKEKKKKQDNSPAKDRVTDVNV